MPKTQLVFFYRSTFELFVLLDFISCGDSWCSFPDVQGQSIDSWYRDLSIYYSWHRKSVTKLTWVREVNRSRRKGSLLHAGIFTINLFFTAIIEFEYIHEPILYFLLYRWSFLTNTWNHKALTWTNAGGQKMEPHGTSTVRIWNLSMWLH